MAKKKFLSDAHSCLLGLSIAVLFPLLVGEFNPVAAAEDEYTYTLDVGDKVKVKVHEWPDVGGEYRISQDGMLPLPVLGDLPVRNMVPKDVAAAISLKLKQKSSGGEPPTATVEITQYRPVFVLGHVMRPGEYEYRPKLNVVQAVSISGGLFRFNDPGLQRLDRDSIQARGDLQNTLRRVDQLQAQSARISAEQKGADSLENPPEFATRLDDANVKQVLEDQRLILTSNRKALAQEVASAANMRDLLAKEIVSLQQQMDAESRQLGAVVQEMDGVKILAERGLTTSPRTYLLERTKAQITGQKQAIETSIIRSRQSLEMADQRLNQYRSVMMDKLNTEQVRIQGELGEAKEKARTLQRLVMEAEISAPAQIAQRYGQDNVRYVIIRSDRTGGSTIPGTEETLLMPGDVLKIERVEPEARSNDRAENDKPRSTAQTEQQPAWR